MIHNILSGFRFQVFYLPATIHSKKEYKIIEKMRQGSPNRSHEAYEILGFLS